jgi:hypothetical protein
MTIEALFPAQGIKHQEQETGKLEKALATLTRAYLCQRSKPELLKRL